MSFSFKPPSESTPPATAPQATLTPSASAQMTIRLTHTLYRGLKEAQVITLQQFLISRSYLAAGTDSGLFDNATEMAVKKFQCDQGIVCQGTPSTTGFGSVDEPTRTRINSSLR